MRWLRSYTDRRCCAGCVASGRTCPRCSVRLPQLVASCRTSLVSEQTVRRVLHDRDRRSCTRCASACLCASSMWLPRSRYVLPCEYVRFFRTVTSAHDAGKHASFVPREREWLLTNGALRPSRPGLPVRAREHGVRAPRATAAAAPPAALSSCAAAGGALWWRCTRTSPRAWPLVRARSREYAAATHLPSWNGREPTAARATTRPRHLIAALPW